LRLTATAGNTAIDLLVLRRHDLY